MELRAWLEDGRVESRFQVTSENSGPLLGVFLGVQILCLSDTDEEPGSCGTMIPTRLSRPASSAKQDVLSLWALMP